MSTMTYNERVQTLAKKMANEDCPLSRLTEHEQGSLIRKNLRKARIAIAEMAELTKQLFWASDPDWIEEKIKEQGLILDDGQEFDPEKEAKTISVSSQMFGGQEAGSNGTI